MSEIALVSAKKIRLEQLAAEGDKGAAAALSLSGEPTRLLSTVQVGITLITMAQGAFGESTFTPPVEAFLRQWSVLAPYANQISTVIVLVAIGVVGMIFGELVPKRMGLVYPESIARLVSRPMQWVARLSLPLVRLLSITTDALVRPFGRKGNDDPPVTEEEIKGLMLQGEIGRAHV